ncbi:MAG TPA: tyrosine-type recombinase/integrase [Solirubrobacterales bacterium]|jgi:integrase
MAGVDTKTRYQGIFARHQEGCRIEQDRPCNCTPSYFGTAWDRVAHRTRKTRHFRLVSEARSARADLQESLRKGEVPVVSTITFGEARTRFVDDAKNGIALNKHRRPYRPNAYEDLESALAQVPDEIARRRLVRVTRGEIQAMVDARSTGPKRLSSSRISSIVNAIRSLYRWAKDRELADFDPAQEIRLPASDAKPRDRVATPAEFARLLAAIFETTPAERKKGKTRDPDEARKDALPFALAGYGSARHQEIQVLDWEHVNLDIGGGELAGDEAGRKPGGSWRLIFYVKPLWEMLREEWESQGQPTCGKVCPPKAIRQSGLLALNTLQARVHKRWKEQGLTPIGLHESRHTTATWLDHAGVSPKVISEFVGHKTPEYQLGAARITLQVYTHMLPGELERARVLFDKFLVERAEDDPTPALTLAGR